MLNPVPFSMYDTEQTVARRLKRLVLRVSRTTRSTTFEEEAPSWCTVSIRRMPSSSGRLPRFSVTKLRSVPSRTELFLRPWAELGTADYRLVCASPLLPQGRCLPRERENQREGNGHRRVPYQGLPEGLGEAEQQDCVQDRREALRAGGIDSQRRCIQ